MSPSIARRSGGRFGIDFKRYFSMELERLQELQAPGTQPTFAAAASVSRRPGAC